MTRTIETGLIDGRTYKVEINGTRAEVSLRVNGMHPWIWAGKGTIEGNKLICMADLGDAVYAAIDALL